MDEVIMDIHEAAEFLKLSENHIYQLKARHQIPYRKLGYKLVFLKSELIQWVRNSTEK